MKSPEQNRVQGDLGQFVRIAHITEAHIQPERRAAEGVAACFQQIHAMERPPDLILNGGDAVMDAVAAEKSRIDCLWDLWDSAVRDNCTIPIRHCLGNHDIWGWSRKSGCTGNEPLFGKAYALDRLRLKQSYYAFDLGAWRIIVLDSVLRVDKSRYVARLDVVQRAWLETTLAQTPSTTPVLILSHIPIVGGPGVFFANADNAPDRKTPEQEQDWVVPAWQVHVDSISLTNLFAAYPNVKVCLSGHTHIHDIVIYRGVTYIDNGAVCGQWWRGAYFETPPGFGVIDLYDDGTFRAEYAATTWQSPS